MKRVLAALGAFTLGGCIVARENVTYGLGRVRYPGYSVEYVDATPGPGTALTAGTVVKVSVRVRYTLMSAERGVLQLQFHDHGGNALDVPAVATEIQRSRVAEAELAQEFKVPRLPLSLFAYVFVVPEGEREFTGELRIRYPVNRPQ